MTPQTNSTGDASADIDAWRDIPILGSYEIAGRGTIWAVKSPIEMKRDSPSIIGKVIEHGGKRWRINGVERKLPATPIGIGETIGIGVALIKE